MQEDKQRMFYEDKLLFIYANTGKEKEATLAFVDRCDKEFGLNLVWVEAKVNPILGEGTTHAVVDYATASRNGEPFEAVIAKFGIPNQELIRCSQELKQRPMESYDDEHFHSDKVALGMRVDEIRRVKLASNEFIYPMVDRNITVRDVREFWNKMPFDLELKDYEGNCDFCWKKSKRKLLTLARENPEGLDWWAKMERDYGFTHTINQEARIAQHERGEASVFFRGKLSSADLLALSSADFIPIADPHWKERASEDMDKEDACLCSNSSELEDE